MFIELQETDSTNLYLKKMLSTTRPEEGTVVYTHFQSAGLGQTGNSWESSRGKNLLMSKLFYPEFLDMEYVFSFNQMVALAVRDAVIQIAELDDVTVKWPNDIYAGNKKIAGILISNEIEPGRIKSSIAGIGMNINQPDFPNYLPNAASLKMITGEEYPLKKCLQILSKALNDRYEQLRRADYEQLSSDYLDNLYLYQIPSEFESDEEGLFYGTIIGIDTDGRLMIQKDHQTKAYEFKEVRFV
jgi:BirA family transcriptional regulator, biotin operon repressor / biotin---[acetyl-CoA-carboxylase] ligase